MLGVLKLCLASPTVSYSTFVEYSRSRIYVYCRFCSNYGIIMNVLLWIFAADDCWFIQAYAIRIYICDCRHYSIISATVLKCLPALFVNETQSHVYLKSANCELPSRWINVSIQCIAVADLRFFREGDFENPTRTKAVRAYRRTSCICELGRPGADRGRWQRWIDQSDITWTKLTNRLTGRNSKCNTYPVNEWLFWDSLQWCLLATVGPW